MADEKVTVVKADGGGGGGTAIALIVGIVAVLAILYVVFGTNMLRTVPDKVDVDATITTPKE
jgi:hypothetical protein